MLIFDREFTEPIYPTSSVQDNIIQTLEYTCCMLWVKWNIVKDTFSVGKS